MLNKCPTQQRFSSATCLRPAGHDGDHEFPEVTKVKVKQRRKDSQEYRVASMLAIILDEPYDDPKNPGEVRIEQARRLLSAWSDARSSVMGMLVEIINLKQGNCVRCSELPCPECGRQEYRDNGLVNV